MVQLVVLAVVLAIVWWLWGNSTRNAERQNIPTSLTFLDNPATFQITGNSLSRTQPVRDALVVGLENTLRVADGRDRAGHRARHDRSASAG